MLKKIRRIQIELFDHLIAYLVKLEPQFGKCTARGERTQPEADPPARTGLPGRTLCW